MQPTNKRLLHIDFLKIIAIYLVLFNHTGSYGFVLFTVKQYSFWYPFYLFNAIFIKIAVPLFFMTSGALLLDKEESYSELLRKRFVKYSFLLVAGSMVEYLYACLRMNHENISVTNFFKILYTSKHATAYWFFYAYLAYILTLPFLRKMAKSFSKKEYLWMIILYFIMRALSILEFLCWQGTASHNGSFSFFIASDIVFYPLIGYFFEKKVDYSDFLKKRVWLLLLLLFSLVSIIICCYMTEYNCTLIQEWDESSCQTFFNILIFVPAITVYYSVKMWFTHHEVGEKSKIIISTISGTVLGIFLFEHIYRFETLWIVTLLSPYIGYLLAS